MITALGISTVADPFSHLGFCNSLLLAPYVCVLGPVIEELIFREGLQEWLKKQFEFSYMSLGLSSSAMHLAVRATAVFFTSVAFGLVHFLNALEFWCNPVVFFPQAVAATIMGIMFGLSKEFSGDIYLPVGMHVGNNSFVWAIYLIQ